MDIFLFLIKPEYVFLGEKDFQQLFLIKKYLSKKHKVKIYSCKTVRNKNFVALSTRNLLLSKKNFNKAGKIAKFLIELKKDRNSLMNLSFFKKKLTKKFKIKIDYLEVGNEKNLNLFDFKKKFKIFIAYYINKVRLIDNF